MNELIASHLHERLGWKNYVPYQIETAKIDEQEISCSLSPLFTSSNEYSGVCVRAVRSEGNHRIND